ncbi:MAG: flagellar basal body L-ring protein FlgH [Flavobacteriaceae bacterium]
MQTTFILKRLARLATIAIAAGLLGACAAADRLSNVGSAPRLSAIDNPTSMPGYRPVNMPMPTPEPPVFNANSLWRSGARTFFGDQRARRIGDILTVNVEVADSAIINNKTARSRKNGENMGAGALAGYEGVLVSKLLPNGANASGLIDVSSDANSEGSGSVNRKETIKTNVAAVITQILPNGNLVIEGRQEVRINFEVRELLVAGIVRPEDIAADNTVESSKIAEARIAYGGRGQISDVQQPRYGQQVLDIILPF